MPQFMPPQFQQQSQPQQFQPQQFQPQQFQPQQFQPRQFQPQVQQLNNSEQQFRPRQFKVPDGYQQRPQFPRTNGWVQRTDNRAPNSPNMEQMNLPYRARFNMQRNNRREQPENASVENN